MTASTGSLIAGRYRVIEPLGEGGEGERYLVEALRPGAARLVLKLLPAGLADAEQRRRFATAARDLIALDHPGIVPIRELAPEGDLTLYAVDHVDGPALDEVLAAGGPLDVGRAVLRAREMLEALAFAHRAGVLHADLRPQSVILANAGTPLERARVLHFGLARILREAWGTGGATRAAISAPPWMAPEQVLGAPIDARADVYSAGCILYEMLAGQPPFSSPSPADLIVQRAHDSAPALGAIGRDRSFPAGLEAVVRCAIARDPADRYADAAAMIEALDAAAQQSEAPTGIFTSPGGVAAPLAGPVEAPRAIPATRASPASGIAAVEAPPPAALDWARPFPGQAIGGFRIVRVLGEGGFGLVCEAIDVALGRRVALKLLRPELAQDKTLIERFRREARVVASLEHPAVVKVFAAGESAGTFFIAMELLEGENLEARLSRQGLAAPAALEALLAPALDALERVHERGVIHRDLKPDNIFVLSDGSVRLLDFGLVSLVAGGDHTKLTKTGMIMGTLGYLAPEQACGDPIDVRTDVYALGVILFRALTGRLPFLARDSTELVVAHLLREPPAMHEVRPDLAFAPELEAVVARALAKGRDGRFPDVRSLRAALSEAVRAQADIQVEHTPAIHESEPLFVKGARAGQAPAEAAAPAAAVDPNEATQASRATAVIRGRRARLEIPGELAADDLRTVFVVAEPRLRFGRSRPDQSPSAAENTLVVRLLPCRCAERDPANFEATATISSSHATIEEREGEAWITDHSTGGTTLDGARLAAKKPARLRGEFTLRLSDAISLRGTVFPAQPDADNPVQALLLRREANLPAHAYLWLVRRAWLGPEADAVIRIRSGQGRIERRGDEIHFFTPAGMPVAPATLGDETRLEDGGTGAYKAS